MMERRMQLMLHPPLFFLAQPRHSEHAYNPVKIVL